VYIQNNNKIFKNKSIYISKMNKEQEEKYIKLFNKISNEVNYIDIKQYSHNIISMCLEQIYKEIGIDKLKEVIKIQGLDKKGWGYLLDIEE